MQNRSPFQVVILVACVLTGLVGLVTGSDSPAAIAVAFGDWAIVWNVALLLGGAGSLAALWFRAPTNLLAERVGMVWLATLFCSYAVAIVLVNDQSRAVAGVGTNLALAVACLVRAWQITTQLDKLRAALRDRSRPCR